MRQVDNEEVRAERGIGFKGKITVLSTVDSEKRGWRKGKERRRESELVTFLKSMEIPQYANW